MELKLCLQYDKKKLNTFYSYQQIGLLNVAAHAQKRVTFDTTQGRSC